MRAPDPRSPEIDLDAQLRHAARSFSYPATPDLAARERRRLQSAAPARPAPRRSLAALTVAAALVVIAASLLLVTPVRARLVEWLRVGVIQVIFTTQQTPTPAPLPTALSGLTGETTLSRLAEQPPFPLRIPAYPENLGDPQHVYLQDTLGIPVTIFIWSDPADPGQVALALYQIGPGEAFMQKFVQNVQETTVNGQPALWVEGPYLLTINGETQTRRIVEGRALLWTENGITYRLETGLPLEEALKIAASLQPLGKR